MKYSEARNQMIQTWGQLSSQWGINRTMGQIHALLMISPEALTSDQIIAELGISRGGWYTKYMSPETARNITLPKKMHGKWRYKSPANANAGNSIQ